MSADNSATRAVVDWGVAENFKRRSGTTTQKRSISYYVEFQGGEFRVVEMPGGRKIGRPYGSRAAAEELAQLMQRQAEREELPRDATFDAP